MVKIGEGFPCFIIAEAGVNHNGEIRLAKRLIDVAKESGADAVKFQTYQTEELVIEKEPQFEMLKRLELSFQDYGELKEYCEKKGILFLSTPFDIKSADFLDALGVGIFKIPSGELTHLSFLSHISRKKKPMIVSTGMADLKEVEAAVKVIQKEKNVPLVLLHCVSRYPTDPKEVNLKAMETLKRTFNLPVGFSDHTLGITVSLAAAALGACVIEKHFTLDKTMPGPDHKASLEPDELKKMVKGIRDVEDALGDGLKKPCEAELETARVARKSLVAQRDIRKGSRLALEWVSIKRPGTGLAPSVLAKLVGLKAKTDIPTGALLTLEMFEQKK